MENWKTTHNFYIDLIPDYGQRSGKMTCNMTLVL